MKQTPANFYHKVPKGASDLAGVLEKLLASGEFDTNAVMKHYFGDYWPEFQKFWTGENISWVGFALAPHNGRWFTEWVFVKHPEAMQQVKADLTAKGLL